MTKLFLISFCLLFLASCQDPSQNCDPVQSSECSSQTPPGEVKEPFVAGPADEPPTEAYLFDATVNFVNFEAQQEEKVRKAIELIKKVIESAEFKHRVINFTYSGKKQFVDNKGFTNEQVYQILLNGKEDLVPEVDHEMDLELELYYSSKNTVGYTYPNTLRIWMNTKYFNVYTPAEVAGNIFHEWLHKLGFDHATSYSVSRDASVPYAIGYLIKELGSKYL